MVKKDDDQELIDLGKKLQAFYNMGYVNKKQALFYTFLKGLCSGFGAVLGATILVTLLLWILSQFSQVPFVGQVSKDLHQTIETHQTTVK